MSATAPHRAGVGAVPALPVRTSIATVSLSGTLEEKLEAAAAAGFDGVEVFDADLLASALSPSAVRARAAALGLTIEMYQPVRDLEGVPADLHRANLRRSAGKLDVAVELGAPLVLVVSSCHPAAIDDDALAAEQLRDHADLAEQRGVRLAYEALAWGKHVDDYRHAAAIVALADHPALANCLDSFHILANGTDLAGISEISAEDIALVQLADAPRMTLDVLSWSRHHRCFPGQGDFDLVGFLRAVETTGYTGAWSLEVFSDVLRAADPALAARDAQRSLHLLHRDLRSRGTNRSPAVRTPPPRPRSIAFVELSADRRDAATPGSGSAPALAALGFTRSAVHRSKPVALWTRDAAAIVVHEGDDLRSHTTLAAPCVVALGLATGPAAAHRRLVESTQSLLAERVERVTGPGEADLVELVAPDGSTVLLLPEGAGSGGEVGAATQTAEVAPSWTSDFVPVAETGAATTSTSTGPSVLGIDHVAYSVRLERFDETVLYYGAVLGLGSNQVVELPFTHGLVRSRALADPSPREVGAPPPVRVVVNAEPAVTGGLRVLDRAAQHIALATDDVIALAESVLARGGALLRIGENYYRDLAGRLPASAAITEADLARMARCGVMWDADADGEFLHCYTAPLGEHLVIELCQRIGGYRGYGEVNAGVRQAALARSRAGRSPAARRRT